MDNNLEFNKSIVKYFMDFLETDFHKRTLPKRKIVYTNKDNLIIGCNLKKYKKIEEKLLNILSNKMDSISLNIKKGEYCSVINDISLIKLGDLLKNSCSKRILDINKRFVAELGKYLKDGKSTDVVIIDEMTNDLVQQFRTTVIEKFINDNSGFLLAMGIQEDEFFVIEDAISNIFETYFKDHLMSSFERFRTDNGNIKNYVDFFEFDDIKSVFITYFSEYSINDLYFDIMKMNSSKKILNKQEFYFSICDITYDNNKYPIFYIPFDVQEDNEQYVLNFDSQLYINKKCFEYIIQEIKQKKSLTGNIELINERITYLTELEKPIEFIQTTINKIINYFSISNDLNLLKRKTIKNDTISISNALYFNIFDNSDDALVNDYEELLQLLNNPDSSISKMFVQLIDNFMTKNPESIDNEVAEEWDAQSLSEKLVFKAPVPLNEEQLKILNALENSKCKYVTVQGPPGTGKSHTITAIVFDMILKNKSVLVLSDKKEALDVVEDKITSTLNKVRTEENFQNPILRLGKTGNTYSQILSQSSIDKIKTNYKVLSKNLNEIDEKINKYCDTIEEDIDFEQISYEKIKVEDILRYEYLDERINKKIDIDEILKNRNYEEDILNICEIIDEFSSTTFFEKINDTANFFEIELQQNKCSIEDLLNIKSRIDKLLNTFNAMLKENQNFTDLIVRFGHLDEDKLKNISKIVEEYKIQKSKLFGFLFQKNKMVKIVSEIKSYYDDINEENIEGEIGSIDEFLDIKATLGDEYYNIYDKILFNDDIYEQEQQIAEILSRIKTLKRLIAIYNNNFGNINFENLYNIFSNISVSTNEYRELIEYLVLRSTIVKNFSELSLSKYSNYKSEIENLVTLKTTSILDGRVLDFYNNNISTAKLLRKIIQQKQKFPKQDFEKLKNAFPCILAGIRDYAEYIPLEFELFDLVIIDEASQVSIAQAFPALIRAKKVLVLGDKKQFSNVKSNQAKIEINAEYKNKIKDNYIRSNYYNSSYALKLENFDIKSSVLDFFESISNYQAMLYKYFRGYKEIISYSNQHFYDNKLQVMKIRGKDIDEVIKFHHIKHDGKIEFSPKTNKLECDFIISEIIKLLDNSYSGSIGIITPHTNQAKLILNQIDMLPQSSEIKNKFNLKIMTFDSCQGEERDIIFYSMVANESSDSLWGIFPKDLNNINLEEDGNLRAQRLNVGFSRAKECMYFVISQPLDKFSGEIGKALRHYYNIIEVSKKEKSKDLTDKKSPMEPMVMEWFYQTEFWKINNDNIEFIPQFELGKYLKQLDPTYKHPLYCVDFLLLYKNANNQYKIIIEYDGFKEHFTELLNISHVNYNDYYKEDDIYRQKVLESYGYKFLRINKFNVGENPVHTLNQRLYELTTNNNFAQETFKQKIFSDINGLNDGYKKQCPNCDKILDISYFEDSNLISGIGKICRECKESKKNNAKTVQRASSNKGICPKCGRKLVVRYGSYGKFYGCSGFPYCRYTQKLK